MHSASQRLMLESALKRCGRQKANCRSALILSLIFASLLSCAKKRDPQAALTEASDTLNHGDTTAALRLAEEGYNDFHNAGPDWAWKFTILRARALYRQGLYEPALEVLSS